MHKLVIRLKTDLLEHTISLKGESLLDFKQQLMPDDLWRETLDFDFLMDLPDHVENYVLSGISGKSFKSIQNIGFRFIKMEDGVEHVLIDAWDGEHVNHAWLPKPMTQHVSNLKTGQPSLLELHEKSSRNYAEVRRHEKCGCFCCLEIFPSEEALTIVESDNHNYSPEHYYTARCPHCGVDSILPDSEDYDLTIDLLQKMQKQFFGSNIKP